MAAVKKPTITSLKREVKELKAALDDVRETSSKVAKRHFSEKMNLLDQLLSSEKEKEFFRSELKVSVSFLVIYVFVTIYYAL